MELVSLSGELDLRPRWLAKRHVLNGGEEGSIYKYKIETQKLGVGKKIGRELEIAWRGRKLERSMGSRGLIRLDLYEVDLATLGRL